MYIRATKHGMYSHLFIYTKSYVLIYTKSTALLISPKAVHWGQESARHIALATMAGSTSFFPFTSAPTLIINKIKMYSIAMHEGRIEKSRTIRLTIHYVVCTALHCTAHHVRWVPGRTIDCVSNGSRDGVHVTIWCERLINRNMITLHYMRTCKIRTRLHARATSSGLRVVRTVKPLASIS